MKKIVISKKITIDLEDAVYYFVTGILILPLYFKLTNVLSTIFGFPTLITTMFYYGLQWFWLLLAVRSHFKEVAKYTLLVCLGLGILTIISFSMRENSMKYIWNFNLLGVSTMSSNTLASSMIYIVLGMVIKDYVKMCNILYNWSRVSIIIGVLIYVLSVTNNIGFYYDDMMYSYAICFFVCMLITRQEKHDGIYILIGIICMLLAGTRGPIVCTIIAFFMKTAFLEKNSRKRILISFLYVVIAILILYAGFVDDFMSLLGDFLESIGIDEVRILDYYHSGMLLDDSGRSEITEAVIQALKNNPLVGYGVGGDRYVLGSDSYSHNLVLELLVSFGAVLGGIFIFILSIYIILVIANKNTYLRILATVFFCAIIIKLMFSTSYLLSKEFFIFLGICFVNGGKLKLSIKLK